MCTNQQFFFRIYSHLLDKFLMENFLFCAVNVTLVVDRNGKLLSSLDIYFY